MPQERQHLCLSVCVCKCVCMCVCVCVCVCACTRAGELLPGAEGMDTLFGRLPLLKDQLITLRQPYCLFLLTMFNKHRLFNLI